MTVSTFFPDADPETTSVDGYVGRVPAPDEDFATLRAGAGQTALPSDATFYLQLEAGTVSPLFDNLYRTIQLFDTASIPDSATIDSATMEIVILTGRTSNNFAEPGSFSMVTSTPASNTNIVATDYAQLGTVKQATDRTIAGLTADSATYNAWTLNATGLGNVTKTGVSKFGLRVTFDNDNVSPTWASLARAFMEAASAEEILAGDKRPKLVVTHTSPAPAFTPRAMVF